MELIGNVFCGNVVVDDRCDPLQAKIFFYWDLYSRAGCLFFVGRSGNDLPIFSLTSAHIERIFISRNYLGNSVWGFSFKAAIEVAEQLFQH